MKRLVYPRSILVTGAGGFVGGWLLRRLETHRTSNLQIFACGRNREILSSVTRTLHFDVTNRHEVDEVIAGVRPNVIIHLAAVSTVHEAREAPRQAWDVNLHGTMNVAESTLKHCPQARFIFVSSSEVYGGGDNKPNGLIDETAPLDPLNPYAAAKAAADLMIGQMAREGLNAIRVRPFNHTGPRQTELFVIPAFAAQVARIEAGLQEPVIRVGNLDAYRDFLDVRDVADAYLSLALSPSSFAPGLILNLGSGRGHRIGDILDELIFLASVKIRLETDPARLRVRETPFANADARRIRGILGWRPKIPWSKTVADVLEFWRGDARRSLKP